MYRVLFLGWEYYPVFTGGLGVVCTAMANELADQEMEVYVVLPSLPKELPLSKVIFPKPSESYTYNLGNKNITVNVKTISLNPYQNQVDQAMHLEWLNGVGRRKRAGNSENLYDDDLLYKVHEFKEMVKDLVIDLEFDVIHAHDWMTFLAAIEAKNITGKKCVLHVHATEFDRTGDNPHEIILNIEKSMLKQAHKVIAVSQHTKNQLVERYDIPEQNISVLHNALAMEHCHDIDHELKLGKGKTVIFLGRMVVQKGAENFLYIAQKVIQKLPDTKFIMAGDGPLLGKLMELACELDIQENVFFAGRVSRWEGDALYCNSDLYVMTSGSEPFGITALEAINQGTPILVSKTSGVAEAITNAITVDYWDIDKYADYIVNILIDDVFRDFLLERQKEDFEKISWKTQVKQLIEIYKEIIPEV